VAIALPFAIETTQLLVPWLHGACQSADIVDNVAGFVLGLGIGTVAAGLLRSRGKLRSSLRNGRRLVLRVLIPPPRCASISAMDPFLTILFVQDTRMARPSSTS